MDPKLSNLDPKLQDAYNRVMGTPASGNPPSPATSAGPTLSQPQIDPALASPSIPVVTDPVIPQSTLDPYIAPTPPPAEPAPYQVGNPANASSPFPQPMETTTINQPTPPPFPDISTPQNASIDPMPISNPMSMEAAPPPMPVSDPAPTPVVIDSTPPPPLTVPDGFNTSNPPESIPTSNMPSATIPGATTTVAFNASNSDKNVGTTPIKKGGHHMMPVIVGLGIIVLLVAYTFVWVIIFNVKVPFLPQL